MAPGRCANTAAGGPGRLLTASPSNALEPMPARDEPGHEVATQG
jgi:hypothetical protein